MFMKKNKFLRIVASAMMCWGMATVMGGCSDDDMSKSMADYDPRYKGSVEFGTADYNVEGDPAEVTVTFSSDMAWTAAM